MSSTANNMMIFVCESKAIIYVKFAFKCVCVQFSSANSIIIGAQEANTKQMKKKNAQFKNERQQLRQTKPGTNIDVTITKRPIVRCLFLFHSALNINSSLSVRQQSTDCDICVTYS